MSLYKWNLFLVGPANPNYPNLPRRFRLLHYLTPNTQQRPYLKPLHGSTTTSIFSRDQRYLNASSPIFRLLYSHPNTLRYHRSEYVSMTPRHTSLDDLWSGEYFYSVIWYLHGLLMQELFLSQLETGDISTIQAVHVDKFCSTISFLADH